MAEAEDVITDVARHATVYVQRLWRRHRAQTPGPVPVQLADLAHRLDLLVAGVFGRSFHLRVAQAPAAPGWLHGVFLRQRIPAARMALPATDGASIWLPARFGAGEAPALASARYRTVVLQQAMRAVRGSAQACHADGSARLRELYLLLEARAADDALARLLPGLAQPLRLLRQESLQARPPLSVFPAVHQRLERLARAVLTCDIDEPLPAAVLPHGGAEHLSLPAAPPRVLETARWLHQALGPEVPAERALRLLWRDAWTGELRPPAAVLRASDGGSGDDANPADRSAPPRSAHLARRPEVREAPEDEDDASPGAWMVQPAPPHEQAEDPMGLQRPTDRDVTTAADDFADALSELPEARLVSAPGKPKEVLLSDDPPAPRARSQIPATPGAAPQLLQYPEWDWRAGAYRKPGATVLLLPAAPGPQQWVDDTLAERRGMLQEIRRRFEMLRAQRVRVRRQIDGHDVDLEAWIESQADFRAGLPLGQRLYQSERRSRRDMAIMLLVDCSGSTDGWIAPGRRVIDVEREALLLVCIALEGMAQPYCVLAFSGEGPQAVVVRSVKRFDAPYDASVAQRIAGLEPEHYTRAGAALRHASALLMREAAAHRLLLVLSDGKPNDIDDYEGRYGVEDMRQAVTEAKLQGISPFCLTIDRQAANYLPSVFGANQYALLPRPELLPTVLLDWLRRLVAS
jgi:nitric oxide reductase NorD protein